MRPAAIFSISCFVPMKLFFPSTRFRDFSSAGLNSCLRTSVERTDVGRDVPPQKRRRGRRDDEEDVMSRRAVQKRDFLIKERRPPLPPPPSEEQRESKG